MHRVHSGRAARQLDKSEAPIEVRDLSDWEMVRMLASENATQRGSTAAASLDAVAALAKVMAYRLLRWENEAGIPENYGKLDENSHAECRGRLLAGDGIGTACIQAAATAG